MYYPAAGSIYGTQTEVTLTPVSQPLRIQDSPLLIWDPGTWHRYQELSEYCCRLAGVRQAGRLAGEARPAIPAGSLAATTYSSTI